MAKRNARISIKTDIATVPISSILSMLCFRRVMVGLIHPFCQGRMVVFVKDIQTAASRF